MTAHTDQDSSAAQPSDEPLNAEPIESKPANSPRPRALNRPKGGFRELSWAIFGGLGPFLIALLAHASITGWSSSTIDPANLGYSLFALSLAAIVRIVSHGSGRDYIPWLLLAGITQMVLALYFSGTFSSSPPGRVAVIRAQDGLASTSTPSPKDLRKAAAILRSMANTYKAPSITAYSCLGITGVMSMLILLRCWSPAIPDQDDES